MDVIEFRTENSIYTVAPDATGYAVIRTRAGERDTSLEFGRIPAEIAEGFRAEAIVVFNPQGTSLQAVATRRRVRFYLPTGDIVDTGWADQAACALPVVDREGLIKANAAARRRRHARDLAGV